MRHQAKTLPCTIRIESEDPDGLKGVNQEKMMNAQRKRSAVLMPYRDEMEGKNQWCIAGVPGPEWAKKVFPGYSRAKAMEMLWEAILSTSRVDDDPIAAWQRHNDDLKARCDYINALGITELVYKSGNGTDFTVGLIPEAQFCGGGETSLNGIFFKDLKIDEPDIYMEAVGDDLGSTIGNIIDKSYKIMVETQPDAVLVLGDTNSCLSVIGAKRLHIPIFHMEAGNRCKDECLPEETNRRIVDIISDVNMAYSEHARRYLAECGLPKERTYVTGSPMAEVLHQNLAEIEASDIHQRLGLQKGRYILLSAHREENIDTEKNFLSLFTAINKMAEKYDMPILYSCHPRSRKRLEQSGFLLDSRVIQHEPLGFHDYNCLQMNAFAVVSDSGTLPEESSFFTSVGHPFPAICIRTSTERPEALDKACFFIAGIDTESLLQTVDTAVSMNANGDYGIPVPDYIEENVSTKVVKIIQSYTGIVNKMVWRKG